MNEMTGKSTSQGAVLHDLFREVFRLQAVLSSIQDAVHEEAGFRTPDRRVLEALDEKGPSTVPHVAAMLGVSRQSVQTVCNHLIASGYLLATDNPLHKRSRLMRLSEAGGAVLSRAREKENRIIEQAVPDTPSEDATQACELLSRIREKIEVHFGGR